MRKRPLIIVEWDDITTHTRWQKEEVCSEETPLRCCSVGWKMPSSKGNLCIAPMRDELGDECGDRQIIPKGCIRNIRRIE